MLGSVGDELREARLRSGLRQVDVAGAIGTVSSQISRAERGLLPSLPLVDVAVHAAAVGLDLTVKFYPSGPALRDKAQLALLARFRRRIATDWRVELEVPIRTEARDRRAWDMVLRRNATVIGIEAFSRLRDVQAQLRDAQLKRSALPGARLILLVADTHANRGVLSDGVAELLRVALPITPRVALAALAGGVDPGGDSMILL